MRSTIAEQRKVTQRRIWSKSERRPLPPEARAIIEQLIALRRALGVPQTEIDYRVGWADRLCGKYEAMHRHPSPQVLAEWAQALNARIIVVPRIPMRAL